MQRGIFTAKSLSREAHAAYDGYARRPRSPLASDSRAFNGASRRLLASLLTTPIRLQSCLQLAGLKVPTFDGHLNESNTKLRRCSMEYTPRRKLTREFKLEAVRQAAMSEKPKAQLARELGVRVGQLRTWRLEFEKEAVTGI